MGRRGESEPGQAGLTLRRLEWAAVGLPLVFLVGYSYLVLAVHPLLERWYGFVALVLLLGVVTWGFARAVFGTFHRHEAAIEALAEERGVLLDAANAERMRIEALMEASPAGVVVADARGVIARANAEARRILALDRFRERRLEWDAIRLQRLRSRSVLQSHDLSFAGILSAGARVPAQEMLFTDDEGEEIPVLVDAVPITDGGVVDGAVITIQDISRVIAQREAQAALERYSMRDAIARDLHDDIIQSLYAVGLGLGSAARRDEASMGQALQRATHEMNTVIAELRAYIQQLTHLPEADAGGTMFRARVDSLVTASSRPAWSLELALDDVTLPRTTARQLYLIVREIVSNVNRHAQAQSASLALRYEAGSIRLEAQDDGMGFDRDAVRRDAVGLRSIEERFADLGGSVLIESRRGSGVRILGEFPVEDVAEDVRRDSSNGAAAAVGEDAALRVSP
jgi:two-component system, NarL family, sensor kinase